MSDLAIIVPLGPGEQAWRALLPELESVRAGEIVLVVPDTDPGTASALPESIRRVMAPLGRARQLNAGAAATRAGWLWFLHADSRPVAATITALQRFVHADGDAAIGYFDLRFLDDGPALTRLNSGGAWLRSRLLGLPFGDQGFVLRRRVFDALGGFDERVTGGEDHALVWAARAQGVAIQALRAPLYTSARKYAEQGWWTVTRRHLQLTWAQARRFSQPRMPA